LHADVTLSDQTPKLK